MKLEIELVLSNESGSRSYIFKANNATEILDYNAGHDYDITSRSVRIIAHDEDAEALLKRIEIIQVNQ